MKISEIITEACWKGYHKEGMKTMFGKKYPNCVKNEGMAEDNHQDDAKAKAIEFIKKRGYGRLLNSMSVRDIMQLIRDEETDYNKSDQDLDEGTASGDSSLHDWFSKSKSSDGKPGWVQIGGRYAGKPCAKQPGQKTKPKCGSSKMKRSMSKKEEEAAARRKRREDPNPNRSGQAKNVNTKPKRKVKEQNVPQEVGSPQSNTPSNPLAMGISALRMLNSLRNVDPKTAIQNIASQELSNQARSDQDASSNNLKIIRRP